MYNNHTPTNGQTSSARELINATSPQPIDREQVRQQLATLGYKKGDRVFLRAFFPSTDSRKNGDAGRKAETTNLDQLLEHTTKFQAEGREIGRAPRRAR